MPRLRNYLGDGPKNEDLEPYRGKIVKITIEITGRFERFYGDEIMVNYPRGVRYIAKRDICAIDEVNPGA